MATVICNMEKCKYSSKRPLRKWKFKNGGKCYGCTLEVITVSRIACLDGWERDVVGEEQMARCMFYTPIENDENIVTCKHCESELSFNESDISRTYNTFRTEYEDSIICPICGQRIIVNYGEVD